MRTSQRHQLKQDRFAETIRETISWAVEHRTTVVGTLVIAGIVLAAVLGSWWYINSRSSQANAALGKAMQIYEAPLRPAGAPPSADMLSFTTAQERARAAHAEFQKIADQYSHTKPGRMARYMAAMTAVDAGDAKGGEQELRQVAGSGDKDVAALAKFALAGLDADANRTGDAVQLYKELIASPEASVPKVTAQLALADLYQKSNQGAEASKIYQDIIKESPQSPAAMTANQKLASLTK